MKREDLTKDFAACCPVSPFAPARTDIVEIVKAWVGTEVDQVGSQLTLNIEIMSRE